MYDVYSKEQSLEMAAIYCAFAAISLSNTISINVISIILYAVHLTDSIKKGRQVVNRSAVPLDRR